MLHTELERKLPQFLLEKVDKMELIEFPNDTKCKLGFLDTLLRKWFWNPFSDDGIYSVSQKIKYCIDISVFSIVSYYHALFAQCKLEVHPSACSVSKSNNIFLWNFTLHKDLQPHMILFCLLYNKLYSFSEECIINITDTQHKIQISVNFTTFSML